MPPVLALTARDAIGVPQLAAALDEHFAWLETTGALAQRRRERLRDRVRDAIGQRVRERIWASGLADQVINSELAALEAGRTSPLAVADAVLAAVGDAASSTSS
jgi:LAO/AO transport system kinase